MPTSCRLLLRRLASASRIGAETHLAKRNRFNYFRILSTLEDAVNLIESALFGAGGACGAA